jgi:hypothetical protein
LTLAELASTRGYDHAMLGYPVDNRSTEQLARAAASLLGDVEYKAARVIARLTGETVTLQDDNSTDGMPDIRIDYSDGRRGYVEVTTDIDRPYAQMTSILRKKGDGLPRELLVPQLRQVWYLGLSGRARHAQLDGELPALLAELEEAGVTPRVVSGAQELANSDNTHLRRLAELGVVDVSARPTKDMGGEREPGRVLMFAAGASGPAEVEEMAFISWINDLLASKPLESKRAKLARTKAAERHLFLGISYTTDWAGFLPLTMGQTAVPHTAPSLPEEITHLWLMNFQAVGRCLVWYPELGWRDAQRHWTTE